MHLNNLEDMLINAGIQYEINQWQDRGFKLSIPSVKVIFYFNTDGVLMMVMGFGHV